MKKSELKQLIREEIKKVEKQSLHEGIISSFITNIVMLALQGKAKQIDSLIDPVGRRDLIKASHEFSKSVQNYKNYLNRPDVKKDLEKSGLTPEDFPFANEW